MNRLTSRKLWITILAVVVPIVLDAWNVVNFGIFLGPGLAAIVVTYLASQAWVDKAKVQTRSSDLEELRQRLLTLDDQMDALRTDKTSQPDWNP